MQLETDCCAHYLVPDFSEAFLSVPEVQVYSGKPYPISKPLKSTDVDLIYKFHEDTESYFNQLSTLHKDFHLIRERVIKQPLDNSHVTITKGLLDFCNTGKYKPPFTCDYNPFYGTGSLEVFTLNNSNYLVRPDWKNNLRVVNVEKPWKNIRLKLETALDRQEHITGISSKISEQDILVLLQLGPEVDLLQISEIDEVADLKFKKKFKQLILDSKLNQLSKLGVILFDTKFRLYDVETNKKITMKNYSVNSVIKLKFIDNNNVVLLGQSDMKIIDQRCGDYKLFKPVLDECNRLCSVKIDGNAVYLGSRHHLVRTDLRSFNNVEFCAHLMKTSPCYLDCVNNESKVLCLSSQKFDEKVLFSGNPIGSLPFTVPSICDTLIDCQLRNDILLKDQLERRLKSSYCGLKLICDNDNVVLYTCNYFGDIFKQKISNTLDQSGEDSINSLYKWVQKMPEPPKLLNLNNIVDVSPARFALNKHIVEENLEKFTKKSKKTNLFLNHYNTIYNKHNLSSLAANFISIWEDEEIEEVDLVPEVAPIDKVSSWIESNYFIE